MLKWTSLNDLRTMFLDFFLSKGHTVMPSAPLIPQNDPSLLLIGAGMAPFKNYFLGIEEPPNRRMASCQKCIRTPDIERVGKTARHGTYFEMLGNFSFGDYFKREAIGWAWEFCTQILSLPTDKLWVTVYEEDDEAFDIWHKEIGLDPGRIVRLGKADNFWEIGSGPCGPCSELYFDRGEAYGCGSDDCKPGCDCDRFMEFWNLVFTQYDSDGAGTYTPLEHPNIDTGMGLERLACLMQGVDNLFEVDTVQNILKHIGTLAGIGYGESPRQDESLRVITDHIRSTTFMINDGVVPSNEGRGYVLRRLLRRAARHGRLIGITEPFLYKVCDSVIAENSEAYPELIENRSYIIKVIQIEEERFSRTIDQGMEMLRGLMDALIAKQDSLLPGDQAFKLYDTFGFPIDLTREILAEHGLKVDEQTFAQLMREQRERARAAHFSAGDLGWEEDSFTGLTAKTRFDGYNPRPMEATIIAMMADGAAADTLIEEQQAAILLDVTPFYAEGGGQVGDIGRLVLGDHVFDVSDCKKSAGGHLMHIGVMKSGSFKVGDRITAVVDIPHRRAVMRNHSAAHLLHHALRAVLGDHVHQSGSYVDDQVCRFDFSHFSGLTEEELRQVEFKVNDMILAALPVVAEEMSLEESKAAGAIALFGEKYSEQVRVVRMGDESVELCGGTHVDNTAQIGLFKIRKESSVAAGIRRIEAVTGRGVLGYIQQLEERQNQIAERLKVGAGADLLNRLAAVLGELKEKETAIAALQGKMASLQLERLTETAESLGEVGLIAAVFKDAGADTLRALGDQVRTLKKPMVAVIGGTAGGKISLMAVCTPAAVALGLKAGDVIKAVAKPYGGSGGGRPESAMGSIPNPGDLQALMDAAGDIVSGLMRK